MSDTAAAIRAAREVQADTLAPEFYREANEWWNKAKKEYKFKNFKLALDYSGKARRLAERAEFESIRNGGTRSQVDTPPDPFARPEAPAAKYEPYQYPTPVGTPQESYDQRKAEEDREKARNANTGAAGSGGPAAGVPSAGGVPNPGPNTGPTLAPGGGAPGGGGAAPPK